MVLLGETWEEWAEEEAMTWGVDIAGGQGVYAREIKEEDGNWPCKEPGASKGAEGIGREIGRLTKQAGP